MRIRTLAAEEAAVEKRRKVGNGELRLHSSSFVQITAEEDTSGSCAAAVSHGGDHVPVFCHGSTEELQFTDLGRSEFGTGAGYNLNTRARKPISSKPSTTIINSRRTVPTAELEEFFASAEKNLHKRFKDKYNFDVVNDTPLEGRFEWVQLKP